jgi:hypothetical protein
MLAITDKGNPEEAFGLILTCARRPDPTTEMVMIIVRPGMEQHARDGLRRHAVGAWWPNYMLEVQVKHRETGKRHGRSVLTGVLPGVVLSPAKLCQRGSEMQVELPGHFWSALDLAPGVVNVALRPSGKPVLLSATDVVMIHKIEAGLNRPPAPPVGKPVHSFSKNNKVRLIDDVLRHFPPGIVAKCHRDGHIDLDMNMLGAVRLITVLPHQIELA